MRYLGERLRQTGLLFIDEMNTTCCYAVQNKVWVYDPDGNAWEIFYTKDDSEFESAGEVMELSLCCVPSFAPVTVEFTSFKVTRAEKVDFHCGEGNCGI